MTHILLIEDDPAIQKGLEISLEEEHYQVTGISDGLVGYQTALKQNFDLIILDLMLPGKNGQDICRELRANGINTPILMLTSRKEESDKVLGLELGADDYVCKPFSVRELLARIKALLRRSSGAHSQTPADACSFGTVNINFSKREAFKNNNPIKLSDKEYKILKLFFENSEFVISRDRLLDEVWGYENFPTTRTVDTFILNLRKKIEDDPANPRHILTIHGTGYKFIK